MGARTLLYRSRVLVLTVRLALYKQSYLGRVLLAKLRFNVRLLWLRLREKLRAPEKGEDCAGGLDKESSHERREIAVGDVNNTSDTQQRDQSRRGKNNQ